MKLTSVLPPARARTGWRLAFALTCAAAVGGCVVAPVPRYRTAYPAYRSAPPPPVAAAPMYFYPERAQPESVQDRDRYECYRWAVRESGTDPGMTAVSGQGAGGDGDGVRYGTGRGHDAADVVGGAATGAILGAAVSSPRHAGGAAVIGAIFGAAIGAASGDARERAYDDAQARQAAAAQRDRQPLNNFRRAMSACMQGRGYHVE